MQTNHRSLWRRVVAVGGLVGLSIAAIACSDRTPSSAANATATELLSRVAAAKSRPLPAEESKELENRLFDEFVRDVPEHVRERERSALDDRYHIVMTRDPKMPKTEEMELKAKLYESLLALRSQRLARLAAADTAKMWDTAGKVRVQVAIVHHLKDPTADAMIYRSANDSGIPTVLLREGSVNALSIQRSVASAVRSLGRDGAEVREAKWTAIKFHAENGTSPKKVAPGYDAAMRDKSEWPTKTLEGIGSAKTFMVWSDVATKGAR
jgi:hypothetical protein